MLFAFPPAQAAPASEAMESFWIAFDEDQPLPQPRLQAREQAEYKWLRANAMETLPSNPFPKGSASHREANAMRRLWLAGSAEGEALMKELKPRSPGTALGLWRWGKKAMRSSKPMPQAQRQLWEDRLLQEAIPPMLRGYALRHALSWAVAEGDEGRLAGLKARWGEERGFGPAFQAFQRLFGLLGGPAPVIRLWRMPEGGWEERRLDELGARRFWICPPLGEELPALPDGTAWIVPTSRGDQDLGASTLRGTNLQEAEALRPRLEAAQRNAFLAPARRPWEELGLAYFPILMELDEAGNVLRVRMGDAAPAQPN